MCLIGANSENGRSGRFGRPAEPSAPTGRRFGRLSRYSRFSFVKLWKQGEFAHAAMVIESVQSLLPSTRLVFVFFNWRPRFRQVESEICCFEEFCV